MRIETLTWGDNYIYLGIEGASALVVDPGSASPVERALDTGSLKLELVLVTHHHGDHTGGVGALTRFENCRAVGPAGGTPFDTCVSDGDATSFVEHTIEVIGVPGHTRNDVAYYLPDSGVVFTGDCLFACGCGRLFARDPRAMWKSLCRLRALPPDTQVLGGHDYTLDNLRFAIHIDPDNDALKARLRRHAEGAPQPSTIEEECATNPFLRCDDPAFMSAIGMPDSEPVDVFAEIRRRKDRW